MAAEYLLLIKTAAGVTLRALTGHAGGFLQLYYEKRVNQVGMLTFELHATHAAIDDLDTDSQVEVWRRDLANSVDWEADFYGLFRDEERRVDGNGTVIFRAICVDQMNLLAREVVAWYANTADRSVFDEVKASTVMTNLVRYNLTADATTGNGRLYTTDLSGITYETDDDDGGLVTLECANMNLLEALMTAARVGDRDFWLDKTGAQSWVFRTDNYLGDDRSSQVTFALNYGNMANPVLRRGRLNEKTRALVGGPGSDTSRTYVVRTGENYSATNSHVIFVNATNYTTTEGLNAAGDALLDELEARDDLTWEAIQTPGALYGVHYFHGDLVTGYFQGVTAVKQITDVKVQFQPAQDRAETISIGTSNI